MASLARLRALRPISLYATATQTSRTPAVLRPAASFFSTSAVREETGPIKATKETLKKADRLVSNAAVKGIEKGEQATHKIKDTLGTSGKKAEYEAKKAEAELEKEGKKAKDKAEDVIEEAKEKADEIPGKA
ncbi:hypothetical protein AJ80_05255 [Polytolypa hystricis UAMH7299]|uniref:LEA domain-containing protein n=1 Tax=Polytolypa hystricis (strain UAMH7299) TaxID=1447883 RepID=A0A2B7Y5T9_POLH7|nr:hypothetical protein AJ80_05255 [Polytolypa hystricis UAMH7299]